jgi:hypothetical protein|tara:strand:+ start:123 stop:224 length:102 start_codon:yes stop_codon:yes gene_type:complete
MNIGDILDEISAQLTEQIEKEHIRILEHDEKHS